MLVVHAQLLLDSAARLVVGEPQSAAVVKTAKDFLVSRPFGVYTCVRAIRAHDRETYHFVQKSFHLQRLWDGIVSLDGARCSDAFISELLQSGTWACVDRILRAAESTLPSDVMVTILWTTSQTTIDIGVHVCAFPKVSPAPMNVLVHGEPRRNPVCKHSQWIADRAPLERHLRFTSESSGVHFHECILYSPCNDGDRDLLEGLITNLFVVKDGTIFTSGANILPGSTRELVINACDALRIPVVLEAPKLSEMTRWQAAFLTSATRIVVPIASMFWHPASDAEGICRHDLVPPSTVENSLKHLRHMVEALWLDS